MKKVIGFFKKLLGFKKFIQWGILIANNILRIKQDLETIEAGGKLKMIDEDNDGVPDLIDSKVE